MKVIRDTESNFSQRIRELSIQSSLFDPQVEERTRVILQNIKAKGDQALLEYTNRFDGANLAAEQLAVTQAELMDASLQADDSLRAAVAEAGRNIARFAQKSRRRSWSASNSHGAKVGEKFDPFQRVGIYIPGGPHPWFQQR